MRLSALFSSVNASPICVIKAGTNFHINGSSQPIRCACRIALRIILRTTYPRPSFEGKTPSAIKKADARKWSAITRWDTK